MSNCFSVKQRQIHNCAAPYSDRIVSLCKISVWILKQLLYLRPLLRSFLLIHSFRCRNPTVHSAVKLYYSIANCKRAKGKARKNPVCNNQKYANQFGQRTVTGSHLHIYQPFRNTTDLAQWRTMDSLQSATPLLTHKQDNRIILILLFAVLTMASMPRWPCQRSRKLIT